jgi:hypothetical protein
MVTRADSPRILDVFAADSGRFRYSNGIRKRDGVISRPSVPAQTAGALTTARKNAANDIPSIGRAAHANNLHRGLGAKLLSLAFA